jgi:hypothetical protein
MNMSSMTLEEANLGQGVGVNIKESDLFFEQFSGQGYQGYCINWI